MWIDEGSVQTKFFFGSVSIYFPSNLIEVGVHFVGRSFLGSFKKEVLGEMRQTVLVFVFFIAGTHVSNQRPVAYLGVFDALVNQLQSVREAMNVNHKAKVRWILGWAWKLLKKLFRIPEMVLKIDDLVINDF